jgi:hypothetical protein
MGYVGAVIACLVLGLILFAYVSSKISDARLKRRTRKVLPEIQDFLQVNKCYKVTLSDGKILDSVTFLGISPIFGANPDYLPFPLQRWVILLRPNGKRLFLKPQAIRYYEEL